MLIDFEKEKKKYFKKKSALTELLIDFPFFL